MKVCAYDILYRFRLESKKQSIISYWIIYGLFGFHSEMIERLILSMNLDEDETLLIPQIT